MSDHGAPRSLEERGQALVERLGGRWHGGRGCCRCPAHEDRTPSLGVRVGRQNLLLHCFAGCDTRSVLRALRELGLGHSPATGACGEPILPPGQSPARPRAGARRLWDAARPLAGSLAERYLRWRGLELGSDELRYHPAAPLGPRPFTRFHPALVAAVRDRGGLVAVHRTFLAADGRGLAAIAAPRRGLGAYEGGAVRLGGLAIRLGLAEGIETALSASTLFGMPCWATLGAERFARVALPPGVASLVLFADNDAGGRRAERLARSAFGSRQIEVRYPPRPGDDWNDVLRRRPAGARASERGGGG